MRDATIRFTKAGGYRIDIPKQDKPIKITITNADGEGPAFTFNLPGGGVAIGKAGQEYAGGGAAPGSKPVSAWGTGGKGKSE